MFFVKIPMKSLMDFLNDLFIFYLVVVKFNADLASG